MITDHLLVLQVVVPLMSAPLCILIRKPTIVWLVALLVGWYSLISAGILINHVASNGAISYMLGSWAAPWGIEYRLDSINSFVLLIVAGISAITLSIAPKLVSQEIAEDRIYLFYTTWLLNLAGLFGVIVTGDIFNLFVFIEISSLSSYALISLGRDRIALVAAYRYLILGTIGATFFLIGVGLLYVITGTLNMADLAERLPNLETYRTVVTALAFITVGISIKFALFPLHSWLPNAYTYAPSIISAFMAATTTKVFIYVLLVFLFLIFGKEFAFEQLSLNYILMLSAIAAIFSGSLSAIYQVNIKRMLAYSSVAQIGYMILGISMLTVTGLTGGIIHLFNHALIKCGLFICMGFVFYRTGSVRIEAFRGLGRRMPWTMAAFVILGLSLIGTPLTVGFISKWYLIQASLELNQWWLAVLILLGSLLSAIYIWKVVETAYFQTSSVATGENEKNNVCEVPPVLLIPLWILVLANLYFGIQANLTSSFARQAAEFLLGGSL